MPIPWSNWVILDEAHALLEEYNLVNHVYSAGGLSRLPERRVPGNGSGSGYAAKEPT